MNPAQAAETGRWFEISSQCKAIDCSGSGRRSQRSACVAFEYVECAVENGKPTVARKKRETYHRRLLDYWTGDLGRFRDECAQGLAEIRKELTQTHNRERPLGTCAAFTR